MIGVSVMDKVQRMRKQIISQFAGITIDMDYLLCIPAVHATYQNQEIVVDFGGGLRKMTDGFPKDKADMVIRWVSLHRDEIGNNHYRIGHGIEPLLIIAPLSR